SMFISSIRQMKKLSSEYLRLLIYAASSLVIIMMGVGIYVHFHPNVPAEVLPLKIKPPYIPAFFMALAITNITLINNWLRNRQKQVNIKKPGVKINQEF